LVIFKVVETIIPYFSGWVNNKNLIILINNKLESIHVKGMLYIGVMLLGLSLIGAIPGNSVEEKDKAYHVAREMFANTKKINTISYTMLKQERIDGEMRSQVAEVKLCRSPFRVYLRQKSPKNGVEVLYPGNKDKSTALVNPNGFPWMNLNMDPYGNTMRKDQHHTIFESGFDHVVSILEHLFDKYGEETKTLVTLVDSSSINGQQCWTIEFNNPYFKYENYTVKENETVLSIAEKFKLSEYMILHYNSKVDDYDDVSEGQVIKIPNDYSPKMRLCIERKRMIPVFMQIYDDKGLYEQYEYLNTVINPKVMPNEFTEDFEGYEF